MDYLKLGHHNACAHVETWLQQADLEAAVAKLVHQSALQSLTRLAGEALDRSAGLLVAKHYQDAGKRAVIGPIMAQPNVTEGNAALALMAGEPFEELTKRFPMDYLISAQTALVVQDACESAKTVVLDTLYKTTALDQPQLHWHDSRAALARTILQLQHAGKIRLPQNTSEAARVISSIFIVCEGDNYQHLNTDAFRKLLQAQPTTLPDDHPDYLKERYPKAFAGAEATLKN
jgi:hypothetical protein